MSQTARKECYEPCIECYEPARWFVWYQSCVLAVGPTEAPVNIAYHGLCDNCTFTVMEKGRNGYQVACVKPIPRKDTEP